ncbi:MAG: glycoside hydrolase family 1 protein [Candidatus Sericytochromatia bacterium]|nr:glycoside hydrolase family 1 protein [Candidatus Tanganyikabacteria bacterium]
MSPRRIMLAALVCLALAAAGTSPAEARRTFLWGVSTAGHQVEGGDTSSQWHAWEEQGRTPERNPRATDSLARFREDIALAADMGLTAYRFSMEWCRVEPEDGRFDPVAIAHYARVAAEARARGMTPIVTLFHFAYPAWLDAPDPAGNRGWERDDAPERFARYVAAAAPALADSRPLWLTINEPLVFAIHAYFLGQFPPGKRDPFATLRVVGKLLEGHGLAYAALHRAVSGSRVSFNNMAANVHLAFTPARPTAPDLAAGSLLEAPVFQPDLTLFWLLRPRIREEVDFAAFDYYFPTALLHWRDYPHWDWPVYPGGIREAAAAYHKFFRRPVLVAENGMATRDGAERADGWTREAHLVAHAREVVRARRTGIPIFGYCYWSLLDNYEWGSFTPRFGLYSVDYSDAGLPRRPTAAVAFFRDIAKNDGVTPELERLALLR